MSDIIPVFLGADLNCYNFARAFHEAYGVESYAYGRYPMAPTKYSKLVHFTTVPDMDNEDTMLRILHDFAAQHKGCLLYTSRYRCGWGIPAFPPRPIFTPTLTWTARWKPRI